MEAQEQRIYRPEDIPKGRFSPTSLVTALTCGDKYRRIYIEEAPRKTSVAQLVGLTGHATYEVYYRDKLAGTTLLNGTQMAEKAISILEEEIKENEFSETVDKDALIPSIKVVTSDYVDFVGVHTTPKVVEHEVRYKSRCGIDVLGYIDLIREPYSFHNGNGNGNGNGIVEVIADYKITGKKWPLSRLVSSLQFHLYAMATGVQAVEIQNIINSPKKGVLKNASPSDFYEPEQELSSNIRMLRHVFDERNFNHVERIIEAVAKMVTSGVFVPTDPSNWWCDPRFCNFYKDCRG